MKIEAKKYKTIELVFILYCLLSILFFIEISDFWEFRKLKWNIDASFNFLFFRYSFASILVIINLVALAKIELTGFIYSILMVVMVILLIPSALLYSSYENINPLIFFSHNLFFYSLIFFSKIKIKIPIKKFKNRASFHLLLIITILGIMPYLRYLPYINLKNLLFKEIYETRDVFKKVGDMYLGYTYSWFNKIILPTLLAFAIFYKKKLVIVFSVVLLVFLFLLGAHKTVLIGIGALLLTYKLKYNQFVNYFAKALIILTSISLFLYVFFDYSYLSIYTIRRGLFIPALLDVAYFDLFENNYLYWSESFFKGIIKNKYDVLHPYLIGDKYFNQPKMAANNGIVSDGYMNAGMLGVIINIVFISMYFSIINSLKISNKFFGLYLLLLVLIISSSLTTLLLTHGAIILLIVSVFFLKGTEEEFDS